MPNLSSGKIYKFSYLEFFAGRGTIVVVDTRDGSRSFLPARDFWARVVSLFRSAGLQDRHKDWRDRSRKLLRDAGECIKDATRKGDPFDTRTLDWYRRHQNRKWSRGGKAGDKVATPVVGERQVEYSACEKDVAELLLKRAQLNNSPIYTGQ